MTNLIEKIKNENNYKNLIDSLNNLKNTIIDLKNKLIKDYNNNNEKNESLYKLVTNLASKLNIISIKTMNNVIEKIEKIAVSEQKIIIIDKNIKKINFALDNLRIQLYNDLGSKINVTHKVSFWNTRLKELNNERKCYKNEMKKEEKTKINEVLGLK